MESAGLPALTETVLELEPYESHSYSETNRKGVWLKWVWHGGWGADLVFEANVGDDADPRKHELCHGGDASERVLHHQCHDTAKN